MEEDTPADTLSASSFHRLRLALTRLDVWFPIAIKLAVPVVGVVLAGSVLLGWFMYRMEANRIRSDFQERALLITKSMEVSIASHTLSEADEDLDREVQAHLDALVQAEELCLLVDVYAIRRGMPTVIASSDPARIGAGGAALEDAEEGIRAIYATSAVTQAEELDGEHALKVTLPLRIEGRPTLAVAAYLSAAGRDQALAALLRTFVIGVGGGLLLVLLVLFLTFRLLVFSRLRRLLAATGRMQAGDFGARVGGVLPGEARDEMVRLSSRFNAMAEAIQTLHGRLQDLASTDELTGLYNRRYILEALEREIQQARRSMQPLAANILDLDDLKRVNDHYGHAVGDNALRQVGQALRSAVRAGDIAARFGGDEFVVLLPNCDPDALRRVLERIQRQLEEIGAVQMGEGGPLRFTVSVGGALLKDGDTAESLIQRADTALLKAKRAGRDQVRVAA